MKGELLLIDLHIFGSKGHWECYISVQLHLPRLLPPDTSWLYYISSHFNESDCILVVTATVTKVSGFVHIILNKDIAGVLDLTVLEISDYPY